MCLAVHPINDENPWSIFFFGNIRIREELQISMF